MIHVLITLGSEAAFRQCLLADLASGSESAGVAERPLDCLSRTGGYSPIRSGRARQIMKGLLKPIALVTVGLLVGGAVAAGAATTTNPVTLCIRANSVRVSADDTCGSRETKVQVASAEDVAALAARMDANDAAIAGLQASVQAQQAVIDELVAEVLPGELQMTLVNFDLLELRGKNLQPGSEVTVFARILGFGTFPGPPLQVAADGTIDAVSHEGSNCSLREMEYWATGTGRSGEPVESNHITC